MAKLHRRSGFERIARKYDRLARGYDRGAGRWAGLLRRRLLESVEGEVLEVGIGTGANLAFYPRWFRREWSASSETSARERAGHESENRIVGIDASQRMLALALVRGEQLGMSLECRVMDVEHLAFPDRSFDVVVSTFCACVWSDPLRALEEIRRVCRPGGSVRMLEHSRPSSRTMGVLIDVASPVSRILYGCHLNRRTVDLIAQARFSVLENAGSGFVRSLHLSPMVD